MGDIPMSFASDSIFARNIRQAETASPQLASIRSRIREAREGVFLSRMSWLTGIRVGTSYHYGIDTTRFYAPPGTQWDISVTFNIESLFTSRSRARAAEEHVTQAEMDLVAARRALITQVVQLQQEMTVAESVLALRNEHLEATRTMVAQVRQQFLAGRLTPDQLFAALDSERAARESAMTAEMNLRLKRLQWEVLFNPPPALANARSR